MSDIPTWPESPLANVIETMKSVQTYLYRYVCPISILVGTIGCILNLLVFTQKTLRKNPCSIYFIAYNLANLIYLYSSQISLTLYLGYNIDATAINIHICRLRFYITFLFSCLSPTYLIMASIDRILITSPNALTRQRSTCRLAYKCIGIGTSSWIFYHIITLMSVAIVNVAPTISICTIQAGIYSVHESYYSLIKETSVVLLMSIFGLWSIKNIRQTNRVRAAPDLSVSRTTAGGNTRFNAAKDRQLSFMLLMDIIIYTICGFPIAIYLMYRQITQDNIKNFDQQELERMISFLCIFTISIPFCTSFYTNLVVSKTFRDEVKKAITWNRIFCTR